MPTGIVKLYNAPKGYGVIKQDGSAKEVHVDIHAVSRAGERILCEGQKLSYDLGRRNGQTSAVNLKLL